MAKALYRKYRSKSLGDIVGQLHVTDVLARSLAKGRVAHAYLLTGPRGVGKTSIARILAHEINQLPYTEESTHLDIIEIDAASNNGVEDVRDLREKVQIAPVSANKKIYIIDEVHMLSKAAFNALLKTLEEPPEHAVFILATTDADKLPETIISRTQRFHFKAISKPDAIRHLKHIAKSENIAISDDALELIATRGDGSFRDSISLLDQLQSLASDKTEITAELVEQSLGLAAKEHVKKLLEAYEQKDLTALVALLDESNESGVQPSVLAGQLIQAVRESIAEKPHLLILLDQLLEVSKSSHPGIKLLTVLGSHAAAKPSKTVALIAPTLEVSAPIKELEKQATKPEPQEIRTNITSENAVGSLDSHVNEPQFGATETTATPAKGRSSTVVGKPLQPEVESAPGPDLNPGAKPFTNDSGRKGDQTQDSTTKSKKKNPQEFNWSQLVEYTREHYVAIYSVLTKCSHEYDGETLTLYTVNNFYKKKLDDSKYRVNLAKSIAEIGAGEPTIETIGTPPPPKDSVAASVAAIMGGGEEVAIEA